MEQTPKSTIVLLSGGQDSTTCLYWALNKYNGDPKDILALSINYGQRHVLELEAAEKVAQMAGVEHEVITLPEGILGGTSPLVCGDDVGHYDSAEALPGGVEPTFVPARNALFLTIAANRAGVRGAPTIVTGVCEEDYGGYPDCRQDYITHQAQTLSLALYGTLDGLRIDTPLMRLSKAESVRMAASLPGCWDALAYTHTCYDGQYPPVPHNHASILRGKGFKEAGESDPLIRRAIREGLLPRDYPEHGYVTGTQYALNKEQS